MKCPRCEAVNLDEMERGGIVIDLCEQCRGVWLDRGELEKFISFGPRGSTNLVTFRRYTGQESQEERDEILDVTLETIGAR